MPDTKKLVVVVTNGFNDERSSVAWSVANGGIASGYQVTMFLVSSGADWAREFFAKSQPFASGGAYINFLTQDEADRIAFAYGSMYKRLVEVKKKYDPTNFFRMNQNIKPT